MERPAPPRWDLDRDLDQPEDEFFGLIDDELGPTESSGTATKKQGKIGQILENLTDKLVERGQQKEIEEELHELQESQPPGGVPSGAPDLTAHLSRLSTAQDKLRESFLAAENATSLFDEIQKTQRARVRVISWSLWVSAVVFVLMGWQNGKEYLQGLYDSDLPSETWIVHLAGGDVAHALAIIAGIAAPMLLFALSVVAIDNILGGLLERNIPRSVLGLVSGLVGLWTLVALISNQAYLTAVLVAGGVLVISRVLEKLLFRLGWY